MRWDPRGKISAPLNFLRRRRLTRLKNITSSIGGSNPPAAGETQDPSPDSPPIRFGTDGWRGRIAQEVTLASLRRLAVAVAGYLRERGPGPLPVAVGYDGRFLASRFAREICLCLSREGVAPLLSPEPIPTAAVSRRVVTARAPLGLMITASHNPPDYSGVKLKDGLGGTLEPEETARVEMLVPSSDPGPVPEAPLPRHPSFIPAYLRGLKEGVALAEIRRARLRLVADSMHGMGGDLMERVLGGGRLRVRTVRGHADPLFGGTLPEPLACHLSPLTEAVRREGADLGIATDGDADRIGACDESGRFLSPLTLLPLLAMHLIEFRGERGGIARTFAGSLRMERIARRHGLPFYSLPVGFKHVAKLLRRNEILVGGEESGGFGFRGYLPERDGLLSALVLVEAIVLSGCRLSELVTRLEREYGRTRYDRIDLPLPAESGRRIVRRLTASPPRRIAGLRVTGTDLLDGLKLLLGDDGWLLFRPSGTEPVLRLYCEAPTIRMVTAVLRHAVRLART